MSLIHVAPCKLPHPKHNFDLTIDRLAWITSRHGIDPIRSSLEVKFDA